MIAKWDGCVWFEEWDVGDGCVRLSQLVRSSVGRLPTGYLRRKGSRILGCVTFILQP